MTLDEYIQKLEAAQKVLPDMISVAAKNATIRAVEAAQEKTPPTADSLSGINTRTGELKQHWATDSKIIPEQQAGQYVTELNNNKEYVELYNKEIEGNELATLINKIENKNENNLVARDENGLFIENDTNSIIINIKFKQSDSIFRGEKISRNGITNFVNLYSAAKFKCTNVEYHKNSKYIKSIFFEEI